MTALTDTAQALYRFFDVHGALLYVGITNNPGRRWSQHESDKPWWHEVHHVELERHPNRAAVLTAEQAAIRAEKPRYNVRHVEPVHTPVRPANPSEPSPPAGRCRECGSPAVNLSVSHIAIYEYERALAEWNTTRRAKRVDEMRAKGVEPTNLIWLDSICASEFDTYPDRAPWVATCSEHHPDSGNPYTLDYPTTWREWIEDTAHLMGKNWLASTNWDRLLDHLAYGAPSSKTK